MRWICTGATLLLWMAAVALPAAEVESTGPVSGAPSRGYAALSAPACAGPMGFCLVPGCCECPPDCCDNAWAGYCQQKARWQAFWSRIGLPKARCLPCAAAYAEPTPAAKNCVRLPPAEATPAASSRTNGEDLQPLPAPAAAEPVRPGEPTLPPIPPAAPEPSARRATQSRIR